MPRKFDHHPIVICFFLAVRLILAAEPPTSIRLTIPDYTVSKMGDVDNAMIPDGYILQTEDGRPRVPYFVKKVNFSKGYRIQNVVMKERSGVKEDSGLNLSFVMPTKPVGKVEIKKDIYPQEEYNWNVLYNQDGSGTLIIFAYPFYYDPKTTEVEFYTQYEFEVRYINTTVRISGIKVDKPVYDPGEKVRADVYLKNSGKPQEVRIEAFIYLVFAVESEVDLPARTLARLGKADSVTIEWNTAGFPTGDYEIEAVVRDLAGNELDRERTTFRLGDLRGEVTDLTVTPQHFKIGDDIRFELDFRNTGTSELTGECVFRIMQAGEVVDELRQDISSLEPGASRTFQETWNTDNAEKGTIYYAIGLVQYAGGTSEPKSAAFSTNQFPKAKFIFSPETSVVKQEISFDGSMSADPDGSIAIFSWDFGDGGTAEGMEATHKYSLPEEYTVTFTVTDNEGAIDEMNEKVVVTE